MALLNAATGTANAVVGQLIEFPAYHTTPPADYISMKSSQVLLQSDYPDLYALIGARGDVPPSEGWAKNTTGLPNTTDDFLAIATDGTTYAAVGNAGKLWTCTDPTGTWTAQTDVSAQAHDKIYYANGVWTTCSNGSALYTATDPTGTWTFVSGANVLSVVFDGTLWVGVGGTGNVYTATDPTGTWTKNTSGVPNTTDILKDVWYDNGVYVAVGTDGAIWTATDPTGTWTDNATATTTADDFVWVRYGNGVWVAKDSAAEVWTATNPVGTWVENTAPSTSAGIDYDSDADMWVAASNGLETSTDPSGAWVTNPSGSTIASVRGLVVGTSHSVAIGTNGEIWTIARRSYNTSTHFATGQAVHSNGQVTYYMKAI